MVTKKSTDVTEITAVTILEESPAPIGYMANVAAMQTLLQDYHARKSEETKRRQKADIKLFEKFLLEAGQSVHSMANNLASWSLVTWGLVEAFNRWSLQHGYAIGSINVRLATIKAYCRMAAKAGYLSAAEQSLIKEVKGFSQKDGRNVDELRETSRRENAKKHEPVSMSIVHMELLKKKAAARGTRDLLIMCLLLDHGLRCGEIAALNLANIDLATGKLHFYRHKVDRWQDHELTPDTYEASRIYLASCPDGQVPLFVGRRLHERMTERSINYVVTQMGASIGLTKLSPHDARHFWATDAMQNGTDVKSLQDAGGWASPAMPLRYAESAKVANQGVKLTATRKKSG